MKKAKNFKILWNYLKDEKFKLFLYIFLVFITYFPQIVSAYIWGRSLELLIAKEFNEFVKYLIFWQSINIFVYSFLQIPRDFLYNYLEIKFVKSVSKDLYTKIDNLPSAAFEEIGVGEFINRLYTDPDRVMELLSKLIKLIVKTLVVLVVVILSFRISVWVGIEMMIFAFVMGFISYKFFPKIKKTQEEIKKESDKYVKTATENITGIREIKSLGIKENVERNIFKNVDELFKNSKKIRRYEITYYSLNNFIYFILQFMILLTTGYLFIQGHIVYSIFILIVNYIWRIDEIVQSISDFGVNYNKITVSLKRIDEIINNKLYQDEKFGETNLKNIKGVVEFKSVSFKYSEKENNILNNLNLTFEPNKKIAVVGRSGNGKSTIFNLLLRYFDTTEGEILIDNVNIKDLTEKSLRNSISVIRQAPFLFNLTIFENFKLVKENVTLKEVREVCKKAYIDDYIMSLPLKYKTVIGEGGINLSGGQKQRLAIARTLLLDTKIVLFDEATSALDNESQEYIKRTIDELVKTHTVIIVAHRLSTIIDADIINIIEKGKLLDKGNHKELLERCEIYRNLYTTESSDV